LSGERAKRHTACGSAYGDKELTAMHIDWLIVLRHGLLPMQVEKS
jgi:hypothetical protein